MSEKEMFKKMEDIIKKIEIGDIDLIYLDANIQFVLNVCNYYNKCLKNPKMYKNDIIDCYLFITRYFLTYLSKKYNMRFKYNILSENRISFYNFSTNTINISKFLLGEDFERILFSIFHEFRHRMQSYYLSLINTKNNLLKIDPATIIFLKELNLNDEDLYKNNHDCYITEHDANLFAISECKKMFDTRLLEQIYRNELNNYIRALLEDIDLASIEYHSKQDLPIIYEQTYRFNKKMLLYQVPSDSMLSLIFNQNGKSKSYEELMKEKKELLIKYKGYTVDINSSSINHQSGKKRAEDHIEEIYKLIINSDPLLIIQEKLFRYNHLTNPIYANYQINKINVLLDQCPQLITIYFEEINSILSNELQKGNFEVVQKIAKHNGAFQPFVNNKIKSLQPIPSSYTDEYDINNEQIVVGGSKRKKIVEPKNTDESYRHIKEEEYKKAKQEQQKIIEQEQRKKIEEKKKLYDIKKQLIKEKLEDDEELEETHGMSM